MKTIVCHCEQCTSVRRRSWGRGSYRYADIKRRKHHLRSKVRVNLRQGDYDNLPEAVTAGYFA